MQKSFLTWPRSRHTTANALEKTRSGVSEKKVKGPLGPFKPKFVYMKVILGSFDYYHEATIQTFLFQRHQPTSCSPLVCRAATAGKVWSLPRFWVSVCKKQLVKKILGRILDLVWLKFALRPWYE